MAVEAITTIPRYRKCQGEAAPSQAASYRD